MPDDYLNDLNRILNNYYNERSQTRHQVAKKRLEILGKLKVHYPQFLGQV